MPDILRKALRAVSLTTRLLQRRASVENTLKAHRFLSAINYAGRPGEAEALRVFEKSGYTFDDFSGAFGFLRKHAKDSRNASAEVYPVAWAAAETRARATLLPGLCRQVGDGINLERLFMGHSTLVAAATPAIARQARRILSETGVGGEIVAVDVFDPRTDEALFRTIATVRALARQGGLPIPNLSVIAVLCDPIVACAGEWERASANGAAPRDFEGDMDAAMNGDEGSALTELFRRAVDGEGLLRRVRSLVGISDAEPMAIDPAAGFAESRGEDATCYAARLDCLHVLGLHLKAEDAVSPVADTLQDPRAIDDGAGPDLVSLRLDPAALERAASVCEGPLGPMADGAAWVGKWSSRDKAPAAARIVYVFPHIPKTAGSSVAHHFREHLRGYGEYVHVRHDTDEAGIKRDRSLPFYWRDARMRSLARMVFGHGVKRRFRESVPGKTAREIITLREPAERMISHYNFWMNVHQRRGLPVISFDEWYAQEPRNYQVFWIAHNYLEMDFWLYSQQTLHDVVDELLEKFWMVSTLKTFDRDMQMLMRELGLPDVRERKNVGGGDRFKKLVSLTDDLRERLRAENALEYRLYDKWLERSLARHRA